MLTTVERIVFLQKAPIFEKMTSRQLKVLSEIAEEEGFSHGETIFEEGSLGDRMYIIISGRIQILRRAEAREAGSPQGELQLLASLEKREIFGEMAILDDEPRSATARAEEDSRLLSIRKEEVRELIQDYPDIAFGIFKVLGQRVREANRQIEQLRSGERRWVLTVTAGAGAGISRVLAGERLILGRPEPSGVEAADKLALPDEQQEISRRHAELRREGERLWLRDLGSLNGTWLRGSRLGSEPVALEEGEPFRLGSRTEVRIERR